MKTIIRIQACVIWRTNFDSRENGGKKAFLSKLKHQYHVSQWGEHDCIAHNKKERDYYDYPCLS